jgi:transposase
MPAPLFVRDLTDKERGALKEAAGASDAFTRRRAQILRFSDQGLKTREIADGLGCVKQTVCNAIHDFHERGLASLARRPKGPKDPDRIFDEAKSQKLMQIAHQRPRAFEKARSAWSLEALAEVAFEEGLTSRQVSRETIRQVIQAMGSSWQRAKHWIESPDPQYKLKKSSETA